MAPDRPEIQRFAFTVVVLGAMNPGIHHPVWYRMAGLLDAPNDEIEKAAVGATCTPEVARFELRSGDSLRITIGCQRDKWQVETRELARIPEAIQVAGRLFDEALQHTPVGAFGINFLCHCETGLASVAGRLAEMIGALSFLSDSSLGPVETTSLSLRKPLEEDVVLSLALEPSVHNPAWLYLGFNFHRAIPTPTSPAEINEFKLAPMVEGVAAMAEATSIQLASEIVAALRRGGSGAGR